MSRQYSTLAGPEQTSLTHGVQYTGNTLQRRSIPMTTSGLQIEKLVEGSGAAPKAGDHVVVHYTGWLTNGTKFDSSVDRRDPFKFPLGAGAVIKGWDQDVAGMKVGQKR